MKIYTQKPLFTLMLIAIGLQLNAATVTWDGGGDGVNWTDPMNWDTDSLPTAADDVDLNGATVILSSDATVQRVLVDGSGELTVDSGVVLTISGFAGNDEGLEVQTSANVINNGTINISNISGSSGDGLYSKGSFTNNGNIAIDGVGQHGLYVVAGTFINAVTGNITVTNAGQTNGDGDCVYVDDANSGTLFGTLDNNGTITVSLSSGDDGIYVNDNTTFNNTGTVTVSSTAGDNGLRVDDGAAFNNNSSGILTINSTPDDQLFLDNDGAFNNVGSVNLNNGADVGLYVTDQGIFTNNTGGVLNVSSSSNYGIQIDANLSTANIVNGGTITITGGSNDGIRVQEMGVFNNLSGGTLSITNAGDEGLQIDDGATPVSTFNNSGSIIITTSADHGMENFGTFNNLAGGSFQALNNPDDGIKMRNGGVFNNDGAINTNGSGSEDIETDGTTFTNTTNASYAIGPTSASGSVGLMEIKDDFDMGAATITFDLTGTNAITEFDQIQNLNDANILTITNVTANLDWGSYTPNIGDTFKIIDGSGDVAGAFSLVTTTNSNIVTTINYSVEEVEVEVTNVLSIDQNAINSTLVYPNPTKDILNIETNNIAINSIRVYDMLGKEILIVKDVSNGINISNLRNGIYLVKISTNSGSITKKIIKE